MPDYGPASRAQGAFINRYFHPLLWTGATLYREADRNLHLLQDIRGPQLGRALPFPLSPMSPPV